MKAKEKKALILLFIFIACTTGAGFVQNKRLKVKSSVSLKSKRPRSLYLLGDSQVARTLGTAYQEAFKDDNIWVDWFGKSGATPNDFLEDKTLLSEFDLAIKNIGCSDVIVIQLGDNGIQNSNIVKDFRALIKNKCPNALFVWSGPMKAVHPTNGSTTYVSNDPSSPRFLTTYNKTRASWNDLILNGLTEQDLFINNIDIQTNQTSGAFTDNRSGDGVHLTDDSASELAQIHKSIIERFWESYESSQS